MEPETGVQADFIGKRKRAMWRAAKRLPKDARVLRWNLDRSITNMLNSMAMDMYADLFKESPLMELLKKQSLSDIVR